MRIDWGSTEQRPLNMATGSYESIGLERKGRSSPPDAGTGIRAFNTPAAFSPNPTVTGSVIGSKQTSHLPFYSLVHRMNQSMAGHGKMVEMSCHDPLETPKVNAPISRV